MMERKSQKGQVVAVQHILLLEDDEDLRRGICLALAGPQRQVCQCATLAQARQAGQDFDLMILDVNLPDGSGLDFLRQVRTGSAVPVILLTANDMEADIVTGLESGADDYITKPFSLAVLRARVNACLRRGRGSQRYEQAGFCFDFEAMTFQKDGQMVELSKTEQRLLRLLVENRGQTLSRALLLERVWTDAQFVEENALSVTVKRLRDKLEDRPSQPQFLKTVYGLGYTWAEK